MAAHSNPITGEKVVMILHGGRRVLGRVADWPRRGDVRLISPASSTPKAAIKEWWYSA